MKRNKYIKEAVMKVRELSQDEELQKEAELRDKEIMKEKAKILLSQNMNIENIAEITGLTIEEIEKLKEK